jgi:hypothetical protein
MPEKSIYGKSRRSTNPLLSQSPYPLFDTSIPFVTLCRASSQHFPNQQSQNPHREIPRPSAISPSGNLQTPPQFHVQQNFPRSPSGVGFLCECEVNTVHSAIRPFSRRRAKKHATAARSALAPIQASKLYVIQTLLVYNRGIPIETRSILRDTRTRERLSPFQKFEREGFSQTCIKKEKRGDGDLSFVFYTMGYGTGLYAWSRKSWIADR